MYGKVPAMSGANATDPPPRTASSLKVTGEAPGRERGVRLAQGKGKEEAEAGRLQGHVLGRNEFKEPGQRFPPGFKKQRMRENELERPKTDDLIGDFHGVRVQRVVWEVWPGYHSVSVSGIL